MPTDRTRDVRLGNMDAVCLSNTSLFNAFLQVMELREKSRNALFLPLNGINGVLATDDGQHIRQVVRNGKARSVPPFLAMRSAFLKGI